MSINSILRGDGLILNDIFNENSKFNRDNIFDPYISLKNKLNKYGVNIWTKDFNNLGDIAFEIHQDFQNYTLSTKNYLLLFETKFIKPNNWNFDKIKKYNKIFTWDDDIIDNNKFFKINIPNRLESSPIDGFSKRTIFCCLIASNKNLKQTSINNLYAERIKIIKWFELNAPLDFNLYGNNWNKPTRKVGLSGYLEHKFYDNLNLNANSKYFFPSNRGQIFSKKSILNSTKFSICYENVSNLKGYISEKIFDSFNSGCVPIYWGAINITAHIPEECFIDRRNFKSHRDLYLYLRSITENRYIDYQTKINNFLTGKSAFPFSSSYFANTIVNQIKFDFNLRTKLNEVAP